ncbi:alpha/beta fold hydrolase [Herbiconiux moechotypicola]|uniref:alpha/beta fold hydrolase n=1 Tax=Herbiconiux moechotypicola TaxID=637393 RepID=UPI00287788B4|nr:alpha/beta fold hydrolase [Herbiconiux moechotypicola]
MSGTGGTSGEFVIGGVRLAYLDEGPGDGPVVLNLHGLGQGSAVDRENPLVDWAGLTDAGYRVISYDARGHGASGGEAQPETYRWDALADDLLAVAELVSPGVPVRAFGISMGTATILTALVREPSRFERVVLGAPPTAWETRASQGALYEKFATMVESTGAVAFADLMARSPAPPIFAERSPGAGPTPREEVLPSVFRGAGASDLPAPESLRGVPTPALVLAWATDAGHPLSTAERLVELLPEAELHVSHTAADVRTWAARAATFFAA